MRIRALLRTSARSVSVSIMGLLSTGRGVGVAQLAGWAIMVTGAALRRFASSVGAGASRERETRGGNDRARAYKRSR
ncbi:MAG: hypothetical protein CO096_27095, partial [Armatimonadetes bacterium CG_4_9_14_3_um_filter_66_14]